MIYTKPIFDITWDDVDTFCSSRVPEGAYLDYKEDFPAQLEKTIAAMANTFGGMIIIGVEEDNERKPIVPIKGVKFQRGLSERVTNIILSNITPPIFPEIQVCTDSSQQKSVVVIRVPQSHQTPHAIMNDTKVYLRTNDVNKPEEFASVKDVLWLSSNREKSVSLRDRLYQQAEDRYKAFYAKALLHSNNLNFIETGILTLSASPTYPKDIYNIPPKLLEIPSKISIPDYYGTDSVFPITPNFLGDRYPIIVQDGIVMAHYFPSDGRFFYTEINSFGSYFFRQSLVREKLSKDQEALYGSNLAARVDEFFDSAYKFYQEIGYWGYINITVRLSGIYGYRIMFDGVRDNSLSSSPDAEIVCSETLVNVVLKDQKDTLLLGVLQKVGWTFGFNFEASDLDGFKKIYKK